MSRIVRTLNKSKRLSSRLLLIGLSLFMLQGQTVFAHVQVNNNMPEDSLRHLQGQIGTGQTFRDWSAFGLNGNQNPANPLCERVIRAYDLPATPEGNPRRLFKFEVVGNADARAHNFEAGAYVDSKNPSCVNPFSNGWDGNNVDLDADIFKNPLGDGATYRRPIDVRLGVTSADEVSPGVRYETNSGLYYGYDLGIKNALGIKQSSAGGAYGVIRDAGGYQVNNTPVWCAGIDIGNIPAYAGLAGVSTNIQWPGTFRNNCMWDFRFKSGTNAPGDGNYQTNFGAFTSGIMSDRDGTGSERCNCNYGDRIPGFGTRADGTAENFSLNVAGISNHDGAGTYNGNPILNDPDFGNQADLVAFWKTPNAYKVAFAEAWLTMEWTDDTEEPTGPVFGCDVDILSNNRVVSFVEPGENFNVRLNWSYEGQTNDLGVVVASSTPSISYATTVNNVSTSNPSGSVTVPGTYNLNSPGSYTINAGVRNLGGTQRTQTCNKTLVAANKPYVKVFGNDVRVGGRFENDSDADGICTNSAGPDTARRSIATWVREQNSPITTSSGGSNIFTGASSQLGIFATGEIYRFFSAGMRSPRNNNPNTPGNNTPTPAHDLTFGNYDPANSINAKYPALNSSLIDQEKVEGFGGRYGKPGCIPDYFKAAQENGASIASSDTEITGRSIANGGSLVRVVDGDVGISGDITFASNSWSSVSSIPSVYVVVKGDIYIDESVATLSGFYIAQPRSDGSGGNIYTCSNVNGNSFNLYSADSLYQNCDQKLVVHGALAANQIKFLRTKGTLQLSANNEYLSTDRESIAEVINFSPGLYLADPPSTFKRSQISSKYDFITSLPPIL